MKGKFILAMFLVCVFVSGILVFGANASDYMKGKGHKKSLEEKFNYKLHFIMGNEEELSLSEDQVDKIKNLGIATKKGMIRAKAEIDVLGLDIKSELWKATIDTAAIDKLIEKKYDLKKAKAKASVKAYAALKGMLTAEQKEKMKDLFKELKKKMMHGPMKADKKGSCRKSR